jgi:hypothetical protein
MALYPTAAATGAGPCCSLLRVLCSEEPLTPCKAQAISTAMPRAELHYVFRTSEACPGELHYRLQLLRICSRQAWACCSVPVTKRNQDSYRS